MPISSLTLSGLAVTGMRLRCGGQEKSNLKEEFPHGIGLCTVTSFVPSGNVASTWISGIISGTPSITSSRLSSVAPQLISSCTLLPSRAPSSSAALM